MAIARDLAAVAPFSDLSEADLAVLDERGQRLELDEGDFLWSAGDDRGGGAILLNGVVFERWPDRVVTHERLGDIVGGSAWLDDAADLRAAKAAEPATLVMLPRDVFDELIDQQHPLGRVLLDWLVENLVADIRSLNKSLSKVLRAAKAADDDAGH